MLFLSFIADNMPVAEHGLLTSNNIIYRIRAIGMCVRGKRRRFKCVENLLGFEFDVFFFDLLVPLC